jgi:lipoprotein-anchoring transpeptidase ErfK/SrfK
MNLRSLLLLGVGAAVACATPASAAATTAASDSGTKQTSVTAPQAVVALETDKPKTDATVVKKKTAAKKTTRKVVKAKKPVQEEAKDEGGGFFDRLFGGPIKDKGQDDGSKAKAKVVKVSTKAKADPEPATVVADDPSLPKITSNSGELRSEADERPRDLFATLFGGTSNPQLLPETRALDSVLAKKQAKSKFKVKPEFVPQEVTFTGYSPGTIVIDTDAKFLYLVEGWSTARRYAIAVGREGLQFKGEVKVGDKQEWPRWIPTKDMQAREPKHYGQYKDGMDGGTDNPLGARAIYLYDGKHDTHLRIHGTNQPQSIGSAASNGCFRMINDHVIDLYNRVKIGTPVVIL